ncbi:hypothetical protein CPB85DRAFT_1264308, partial [Mucidula mucida]
GDKRPHTAFQDRWLQAGSLPCLFKHQFTEPGEWSQYPARLDWTIKVYTYKFNEKSQACFTLIHRGSVQSIISRSVREPLSQDEQWPERRPELQLRNRFFGEAQLVSKDSNPSEHNTTFKDDYTQYVTLQTGNFTRNEAYFLLKKAPLGQKTAELGLRAYANQIHELNEFKFDIKSSNQY